MNKETTMVESKETAVSPKTEVSTVSTEIDAEARIAQLEADNKKIAEERDNYRIGMLKAKGKITDPEFNEDDETPEEKTRRLIREEIANSKIAQNNAERDTILAKALKENKELKLAQLNKTNISPAAVGTSNESTPVTSTSITPEQMAYFKSRNFTDKDIERYKKNLQKGGR